jgi:hypothetical protein
MEQPSAVFYGTEPEQNDAFRRLGGAVVYRWDELPPDVQRMLLDQATLVSNEDHPGTVKEDLLNVIDRWKKATFG